MRPALASIRSGGVGEAAHPVRLRAVGDPHLRPVQDQIVANDASVRLDACGVKVR